MGRKISYTLLIGLYLLSSACTPVQTAAPPTPSATPTQTPTFTPEPTATDTPLPPTNTPIPPTETPLPPTATFTELPTATYTVEPTPPNPCPPGSGGIERRQARLSINNQSGYAVYMKLQHCSGQAYSYITVPDGTEENPTVKVLNLMFGDYDVITTQCNGVVTRRLLSLYGNQRLTFTSCGSSATATAAP